MGGGGGGDAAAAPRDAAYTNAWGAEYSLATQSLEHVRADTADGDEMYKYGETEDYYATSSYSRRALDSYGKTRRTSTAGETYAQRMEAWRSAPNRDAFEAPEGIHAIEIQHTLPLLAVLVGIIPALVAGMHTHWIGDVTFFDLEDLPLTNDTKFAAHGHRNLYYLNTPDTFSPEPFAALSNLCFWTAGVGFLLLPGLMSKNLPVGTAGTGLIIALLGCGSLVFHNTASETETWQHAMDHVFMYAQPLAVLTCTRPACFPHICRTNRALTRHHHVIARAQVRRFRLARRRGGVQRVQHHPQHGDAAAR